MHRRWLVNLTIIIMQTNEGIEQMYESSSANAREKGETRRIEVLGYASKRGNEIAGRRIDNEHARRKYVYS